MRRPGIRSPQETTTITTGVREAAWSPDGKRLAATWFDAIWTMSAGWQGPKRVVTAPQGWAAERDPVVVARRQSIVFSASLDGVFRFVDGAGRRRRAAQADDVDRRRAVAVVHANRSARVFARAHKRASGGLSSRTSMARAKRAEIATGAGAEWQGRVSPDGKWIAFVSDREPEPNNDADIWVAELRRQRTASRAARHTRAWRGEPSGLGA